VSDIELHGAERYLTLPGVIGVRSIIARAGPVILAVMDVDCYEGRWCFGLRTLYMPGPNIPHADLTTQFLQLRPDLATLMGRISPSLTVDASTIAADGSTRYLESALVYGAGGNFSDGDDCYQDHELWTLRGVGAQFEMAVEWPPFEVPTSTWSISIDVLNQACDRARPVIA
jgi:hypothetical protein